jgi:hypothetical protein
MHQTIPVWKLGVKGRRAIGSSKKIAEDKSVEVTELIPQGIIISMSLFVHCISVKQEKGIPQQQAPPPSNAILLVKKATASKEVVSLTELVCEPNVSLEELQHTIFSNHLGLPVMPELVKNRMGWVS